MWDVDHFCADQGTLQTVNKSILLSVDECIFQGFAEWSIMIFQQGKQAVVFR